MPALCKAADVREGQARSFSLGDKCFIVARRDDRLHVYLNRCPHQGTALQWRPDALLDEEGEMLRCATHGALFLIDSGYCVAGPCAGERLRQIPFSLREGLIWLDQSA